MWAFFLRSPWLFSPPGLLMAVVHTRGPWCRPSSGGRPGIAVASFSLRQRLGCSSTGPYRFVTSGSPSVSCSSVKPTARSQAPPDQAPLLRGSAARLVPEMAPHFPRPARDNVDNNAIRHRLLRPASKCAPGVYPDGHQHVFCPLGRSPLLPVVFSVSRTGPLVDAPMCTFRPIAPRFSHVALCVEKKKAF